MPRRRRGEVTALPPRHIKLLVAATLNPRLSHPAFRLLALVAAYSWETGWCELNNQQLADMLGVSRQFVSRLIGENKRYGLLVEKTLQGHRFLQPVDGTLGDADSPFRTPHAVLSTTDNIVLSTTDNINSVEEESLKNRESSSTERGGMSTTDNINIFTLPVVDNGDGMDAAFGRVAARWVYHFGDIRPIIGDLLGNFLDDPDLARLAAKAEESPEIWIMAAVEETALTEDVRDPGRYFRRTLTNWINQGYRIPPQAQGDQDARHRNDTATNGTNSDDQRAAIHALLDRFESGELGADEARRQLAAFGYVL